MKSQDAILERPSENIASFNSIIHGGYRLHILFCALVSIIGVLEISPFIGIADGFYRWWMALEIVHTGAIQSDTLLSPIIPYFQAVTYYFTKSFAIYTFIQAFSFYLSVGLVVWIVVRDRSISILKTRIYLWNIISCLIILFPTVRIFPLLLTDSALTFVLICCIFALLKNDAIPEMNRMFRAILLFFSVALCIGIRINSIVFILLVLLVRIMVDLKQKKARLLFNNIIIAGVIVGVMGPQILLPKVHNASTLGMIWEMMDMVSESNDEELISALDEFGDVEKAMDRYGDPHLNALVWDDDPPFSAYQISGIYSKPVTNLYIKQMVYNTPLFLKTKAKFALKTMGVTSPLLSSRWSVHRVDDLMISFGAEQTPFQDYVRDIYFKTTDGIAFISLRPYMAFLIAGTMALIRQRRKQKYSDELLIVGIAFAYYSSFLINTQSFDFRYFSPSFFLVFIVIACDISLGIQKIKRIICKKQAYTDITKDTTQGTAGRDQT